MGLIAYITGEHVATHFAAENADSAHDEGDARRGVAHLRPRREWRDRFRRVHSPERSWRDSGALGGHDGQEAPPGDCSHGRDHTDARVRSSSTEATGIPDVRGAGALDGLTRVTTISACISTQTANCIIILCP